MRNKGEVSERKVPGSSSEAYSNPKLHFMI
jgi:hypothetical protein